MSALTPRDKLLGVACPYAGRPWAEAAERGLLDGDGFCQYCGGHESRAHRMLVPPVAPGSPEWASAFAALRRTPLGAEK